ncbi:MAG TPA: cyclic nucleotide-binding domain-containing protein [Polyangiaceae bacterium]|nr:cyclic nucleotide-binding domain-containing protein [Polyangiaceae bacterium]
MAKPPPLRATPSGELPIDRALALVATSKAEDALRVAVPLAKSDLSAPAPLFVIGCALRELGDKTGAVAALETAADRASDSGNLPLAIASIARLAEAGGEVAARVDYVAKAYAKGSTSLKAGGTSLPPPAPKEDVAALPATLGGAPLVEQATQIVDYARAAQDADREKSGGKPQVAPQVIFSSLSVPALSALLPAFTVRIVPKGEKVIVQGAPGAEAFVLARGELEVIREQDGEAPILLARLGNGALFGEMALLSRSPRAASVVAARPCVVLEISVESLDAVAASSPEVGATFASYCHRRMVANLVRTSPLLGPLSASERQALIERFSAKTFEAGDKLIVQGKESDGLHVIASGDVSVRRSDEEVVIAKLSVGEVVGEVSMIFRRPSNADVVADHPTMTLFLPRARFMEIVREHPTLLAQLYELAVHRDDETQSIVAQEASEADDLII